MRNKIMLAVFVALFIGVSTVSLFHSIEFFGLTNCPWKCVTLAVCFELGQAVTLYGILAGSKERSGMFRFMSWMLMSVFCLIQIIGNLFASYRYLMLNSTGDIKYFTETVTNVWCPDMVSPSQAPVVIVYIAGAILPIVTLFLTYIVNNIIEVKPLNVIDATETESTEVSDVPEQEQPEQEEPEVHDEPETEEPEVTEELETDVAEEPETEEPTDKEQEFISF